MGKKTRKCKECGSQTYYNNPDGSPSDTCQNCTFLLKTFWTLVESINRHTPTTGKPRKIIILDYKLEVRKELTVEEIRKYEQ